MKLTSRGFTLVELMIVIAIIGILAAALFPSMTAYLKRSRDAARISGTKDIATAVGAFFSDKERYPDSDLGCVHSGQISINYMPKGLPSDPSSVANFPCKMGGKYGYGSGVVGGIGYFDVIAVLENVNGGNTGGIAQYYTGSNTVNPASLGLVKGAGSGYVLTN